MKPNKNSDENLEKKSDKNSDELSADKNEFDAIIKKASQPARKEKKTKG